MVIAERVGRVSKNIKSTSPYVNVNEVECSVLCLEFFLLHEGSIFRFMFNDGLLVQVFLPVLIKNHWTLYVYDLSNKKIQLLDSRPSRKKTTLSGIQQNLVK